MIKKGKIFLMIFIITLFPLLTSCAHMDIEKLMTQGRYFEAEKTLEEKIQDISSAKSADLVWLCQTYLNVKKYNKLFTCLNQLERNIDKGDKNLSGNISILLGDSTQFPYDLTVIPHIIKTEALLELGDYTKAVQSAHKAYELAKQLNWPLPDLMGNWDKICKIRALGLLAMAYAFKGDKKTAMQYIEILENEGTGYSRRYFVDKEKSLALGKAYMAIGNYDKVLESKFDFFLGIAHIFSFGIFKMTEKTAFPYIELPKMFVQNKALFETGNVQEAKKGYDEILARPETKSNGALYWAILFDRGRIYQSEGDIKKAIDFYKQSIDVIESQRSTINTEANKIGFVGNKQKVYYQMISALYSDNQYINAFEYVERSKSRALVDLLASNKDVDVSKNQKQVALMLKELETIELESKELDISNLNTEKTDQRNIRGIQIKERIKMAVPELASLVTVSIPPLSEIQSFISRDETLIEYYYYGEDLYAFVLTKNELKAVKLDGKDLIKYVEDFRRTLQDPKSQQYIELAQKLYQKLIKPIEQFISTQKLIIVPHGIIHYLPFNALNNGSIYMIDKYSISYLPSASVMKFLKQRKLQKTESALIFGNPDLGDPNYDLKYAEEEAVAISKVFPQTRVFLRKDATETNFKKYASQFNYIHFATHGIFESDSPLESGLFLSKDNENDGLLRVSELYSLNLNSELVTLSACETALGQINYGDDIVGLTRGFLYAGANSIVASLWKVDDLATSYLMKEFYSNLNKMNKRDALRQAQLNTKNRYEHPYYWAAFQLTGIEK